MITLRIRGTMMKIRRTFYLLSTAMGLIAIAGGILLFVSCQPVDRSTTGTAPANACPVAGQERGEDYTMVAGSDTKREKPLIDVNTPVNVETATFALG
jgi:hypothetical protein